MSTEGWVWNKAEMDAVYCQGIRAARFMSGEGWLEATSGRSGCFKYTDVYSTRMGARHALQRHLDAKAAKAKILLDRALAKASKLRNLPHES